jgi:diguanylate cyclase (GGDEF)-like protein
MLAYHLVLLPHAVSATVLFGLTVLAVWNRRTPVAPWLGGVFAVLLLWTVAYICELAVPHLAEKLVWANVQFIGATVLPVLWLVAVRIAVGRPALPRWLLGLLSLAATAIVVCVYTNPGHLFRGHPALDTSGAVPLVAADYGALYYGAWVPFAYGLFSIALLSLGQAALRGPREIRVRARLLLGATSLPLLAGTLFVARVLPWANFNPAMASLSLAAILLGVTLVQGRLFSITPLARETVVEQLVDGVIVCDAAGCLVDYNPAAVSMLPELGEEAFGRSLTVVLAGRAELLRALTAARPAKVAAQSSAALAASAATVSEETVAALRIGSPGASGAARRCYLAVSATPVLGRAGRCLGEAIVLRDVTASMDRLRDARRLATTDELTGLATRRHLLELGSKEIDRAFRTERPFAVMLLDLDHFKAINDRHGHLAGDELLRAVAAACRAELRSFDLLGRYGGDELAAVLPNLGVEQALAAAERLRRAVERLVVWQTEDPLQVTVSIGVVCGGGSTATLADLIEVADTALYEAKAKGGNGVVAAPVGTSPVGALAPQASN